MVVAIFALQQGLDGTVSIDMENGPWVVLDCTPSVSLEGESDLARHLVRLGTTKRGIKMACISLHRFQDKRKP